MTHPVADWAAIRFTGNADPTVRWLPGLKRYFGRSGTHASYVDCQGHTGFAGVMPSQELVDAMVQYNEELVKAGVLLAGEGLHPTSNAVESRTRSPAGNLSLPMVPSQRPRSSSPASGSFR